MRYLCIRTLQQTVIVPVQRTYLLQKTSWIHLDSNMQLVHQSSPCRSKSALNPTRYTPIISSHIGIHIATDLDGFGTCIHMCTHVYTCYTLLYLYCRLMSIIFNCTYQQVNFPVFFPKLPMKNPLHMAPQGHDLSPPSLLSHRWRPGNSQTSTTSNNNPSQS